MSETENTNTGKEKQELVSGLVDDQLSEIEIHKLLRRHDDDTRDTFIQYGQIRAAARKEKLYSAAAHVALHERISAVVAAEDGGQSSAAPAAGMGTPGMGTPGMGTPGMGTPARRIPLTGLAIAASLVVAVSAGFYIGQGNPGAAATSVADVGATTNSAAVAAQSVSTAGAVDPARVQVGGGIVGQTLAGQALPGQTLPGQTLPGQTLPVLPARPMLAQPASTELRELDPDKQDRLRAYLNRHDRVSRMNPNVRVVTSPDRQ